MRNCRLKYLFFVKQPKHLAQILESLNTFMKKWTTFACMAGLYIHIPFCRSRCIYCGFYSTTMLDMRQRYADALCQEMRMRGGSAIGTIYLGGGTPSLLTGPMLHQLFNTIEDVYEVNDTAEITMECNPDDVSVDFAEMLRTLPINRVSMGLQSFEDKRLQFLRRRHTSSQGRQAVEILRQAGIGNISIDLMFGFPGETLEDWEYDIEQALRLEVEHISAYSLMYEEGTPLNEMLERHQVSAADDDTYIIMYEKLVEKMKEAGYEHYEISNFARPGYQSRHNSSYWDETPYLGIGAAAHSYDLKSRSSNVSDLKQYIHSIEHGIMPTQREILSMTDQYNDMITTRLRTSRGISLDAVRTSYGEDMVAYLLENAAAHLANNWLKVENGHLRLTLSGIMMSDTVMSDLIKTD